MRNLVVAALLLVSVVGLADTAQFDHKHVWGWKNPGDCKGLVSANDYYCKTKDCKALVDSNDYYCTTKDCKAIISGNDYYCESKACKAIVDGNDYYCPSS
jgi:hypothetical protein